MLISSQKNEFYVKQTYSLTIMSTLFQQFKLVKLFFKMLNQDLSRFACIAAWRDLFRQIKLLPSIYLFALQNVFPPRRALFPATFKHHVTEFCRSELARYSTKVQDPRSTESLNEHNALNANVKLQGGRKNVELTKHKLGRNIPERHILIMLRRAQLVANLSCK